MYDDDDDPDHQRPRRHARLSINDEEATEFLDRLANDDEFRAELEKNPRGVLLQHRIDLTHESIPESITLPSKEEIQEFLRSPQAESGQRRGVLGFAILYWVLGAMPLVVAEGDGAA